MFPLYPVPEVGTAQYAMFNNVPTNGKKIDQQNLRHYVVSVGKFTNILDPAKMEHDCFAKIPADYKLINKNV
jgi:hypothetical protein